MHELADDDLMRVFQRGADRADAASAEAFRILYDRHHARVYNFARFMLRDSGTAEDVLQETFLSVARAADRYSPRDRFVPWVMRIVRNRCLNCIEGAQSRPSLSSATNDAAVRIPAPQCPHRRLEAADRLDRVRGALDQLPERQREALAMYAFDSMSYDEIGHAMQVPTNTVKTLIHRGRAGLAKVLGETKEDDR
ncbi:MAG: sigma-70 family RNA polymerase sigma factor [bacterium]|nr:sigma-70 family RNA polymerase sigma factor [bacterium]